MSVLHLPCAALLGAAACACFSTTLPVAVARAQGYGAGYGAPVDYGRSYTPPPAYAPPWQAGAGNRRALDGSYRAPATAPYPSFAPPPIWQGLYLGVHGGWSLGSVTDGDGDTVRMSGGALGLHVGYNAQFGSWVWGLEADGTWSGAEGSRIWAGPVTVDAYSDWHSSLRLRAGYAVGGTLFYVTGGLAFANLDVGAANSLVGVRSSDVLVGYAVGGGIEMKLTSTLSGRIEALHYGFGDQSLEFPGGRVPVDLGVTTVRAGLSLQLR